MMQEILKADVGLIGVGLGGYAALRSLLERGLKVAAVEEYSWIGGQVTSQGLCVLDEFHDPVAEGIGYSRRYQEFRQGLRNYYKDHYQLSPSGKAQLYFNPGNAMNSFMVAEPCVAHEVLMHSLQPYLATGQLTLRCGWVAESAKTDGARLVSVECKPANDGEERLSIEADFFLDGTEAGDLYPLIPVPFRLGADGNVFGELHSEEYPMPECIQSSTLCFAVEFVPGGNFTIPRPDDYDEWLKSHGPFTFATPGSSADDPALMFRRKLGKSGRMIPPAFYYRSIIDTRNFDDPKVCYDRTIINSCNDYHGEPLVGGPDPKAAIAKAKALSRAYLYWIQSEAPRDDGSGFGYPEIRLCPKIVGTADGYAMAPYIREGRRLCAYQTIVEQDIAGHSCAGSRARHFEDSVGLGGFVIDIHRRCGDKSLFSGGVSTKPYQIPQASMVSPELDNFAAAGKCIGTTQIANGAYRLHNIEWAIGEAAGELAAFCLKEKPSSLRLTGRTLLNYQRQLVRSGIPIFWYDDIGFDHPAFEAIQILSAKRILPAPCNHLRSDAQHSVARSQAMIEMLFGNLECLGVETQPLKEIVLISHGTRKSDVAHRVLNWLDQHGWPEALFGADWKPLCYGKRDEDIAIPGALA